MKPARGSPWIFASILLLCGIALAGGGVELALLGGSTYYLVTGVALIASAVLLWRGNRWGMWLYLLAVVYTVVWSFWEIGMDGWALASRIGVPLLLALYFLLPRVRRGLQ
jgi:glucose dehydrogenase